MQLVLSTRAVRNAIFTHESGQVLYKTTHPRHIGGGTTTLYKVKANDDPMDMHDQFNVIGEIDWHLIGSSTFRIDGRVMQSNEFLPVHGILRQCVVILSDSMYPGRAILYSKRTFTGPVGCPYRWDMVFEAVVLSRDDESRSVVARYHRGSLGIVGPKQKPHLEIAPDVEHVLNLVVLTFVYVEKIRMDRSRESTPGA